MTDYLAGCLLGAAAVLLIYATLESEKKTKAYRKLTEERLEALENRLSYLSSVKKAERAPAEVH